MLTRHLNQSQISPYMQQNRNFKQEQQSQNDQIDQVGHLDSDLIFSLSKQFFAQLKDREQALQEVNLIYQQNMLLNQIKGSLKNTGSSSSSNLTNNTTLSFLADLQETQNNHWRNPTVVRQPLSFRRTNNDTLPLRSRLSIKGQQYPTKSNMCGDAAQIEKSLLEVQQKCSGQTYEFLWNLYNNYKQICKKLQLQQQTDNNNVKIIQNLKKEAAELQKKVIELEKKVKKQESLLIQQKDLAQKDKKSLTNLSQRQRALVKSQTALLIKQKLLNEDLKKINSKISSIKKQEKQIDRQRRIVEQLWENILNKSELQLSQEFKTQIYGKCKQNLIKQRNMLSQQQQQLQKQHNYIQKIIAQLNPIATLP